MCWGAEGSRQNWGLGKVCYHVGNRETLTYKASLFSCFALRGRVRRWEGEGSLVWHFNWGFFIQPTKVLWVSQQLKDCFSKFGAGGGNTGEGRKTDYAFPF